jgi:predicted Zn-dependent protease
MKKYFFILVVFIFFISSCTDTVRPFILSDSDEIALGNKIKNQLISDTKNYPVYNKNQDVINYINSLGQKIVSSQPDRKNIPFDFTIINNDSVINAFAILGGHVFIYTGLIKAANSAAELAGVLGHEIGHITQYHCANRMIEQYGLSTISQLIFGNDSSTIRFIAEICANLLFLKFSREDEYQADSASVVYTTLSKYNPKGLINFFNMLAEKYGGSTGIFEALSTHPDTDKRINAINRIINKTPNAQQSDTTWMYIDEYLNIKAKL